MDDVIGKKSFISNEDMTRLSFISTLIRETVRFYPAVGGIIRELKEELVVDGLRIPGNTLVGVSEYSLGCLVQLNL